MAWLTCAQLIDDVTHGGVLRDVGAARVEEHGDRHGHGLAQAPHLVGVWGLGFGVGVRISARIRVRVRVRAEVRVKVTNGLAQTAHQLAHADATLLQLVPQRREVGELGGEVLQEGLHLAEVVAAAHDVDAHEGVAVVRGLEELQQAHRVGEHALGLQQDDALGGRVHLGRVRVRRVRRRVRIRVRIRVRVRIQVRAKVTARVRVSGQCQWSGSVSASVCRVHLLAPSAHRVRPRDHLATQPRAELLLEHAHVRAALLPSGDE
eukprot:scaffold18112_cov39-Phaeocystis_antarctica.AAC.4